MTTVLLNNATPETDAFVKKLRDNSCNFIYKNDVVPRGYGYLSFIQDFVEDAIPDLISKVPVPKMIPWPITSLLKRKAKKLIGNVDSMVDTAVKSEQLSGLLTVMSQYIHVGNLIYYESEHAKPLVLKDMGAFHENTAEETDLFRSIKYKNVNSPMEEFMGWHMDIINGPGLSYPEHELS
jgi:hypothetical protein